MDKELIHRGDKQDLKELKDHILQSNLDSVVKVDFLNYLVSEKEEGLAQLQRLVFDFLKAEEAIDAASKNGNIHDWVNAVLAELKPSISDFTKRQIDLTMALIIQEKSIRDPSYKNIFDSYTEAYRNGGGVF